MKNILFRARFINYPETNNSNLLFLSIIETWKKYYPEAKSDKDIDFEDFVENAIILYYLDQSSEDLNIYLEKSELESIYKFGLLSNCDKKHNFIFPNNSDIKNAEEYYLNQNFLNSISRRFKVVPMEYSEITLALLDLKQQGVSKAILKTCSTKYNLEIIDLEKLTPGSSVMEIASDGFGWSVVHLEGAKEGYIVQELVEMNYEYRMVVIDGKPVTGAGCIEAFTPLDNDDLIDFDPRMEKIRNISPITTENTVLAEYLIFAEIFCEENNSMKDYVLDLCISNGAVEIVEINPIVNFGLYANNPKLFVEAILKK
jgi:hypothetical protein